MIYSLLIDAMDNRFAVRYHETNSLNMAYQLIMNEIFRWSDNDRSISEEEYENFCIFREVTLTSSKNYYFRASEECKRFYTA